MANEHLKPRNSLIRPGETAPDFVIPDQDKQEWRLSDALKKGDVVLSFVPFAFTGTCAREMSCLTRDMHHWHGEATLVGISCDSWAALKAWQKQEGYTVPLLSDIHRTVCRAYGLYWAEKNVSQRGTVIISGKDGKVKWSQARAPGNAFVMAEVEAALKA